MKKNSKSGVWKLVEYELLLTGDMMTATLYDNRFTALRRLHSASSDSSHSLYIYVFFQ